MNKEVYDNIKNNIKWTPIKSVEVTLIDLLENNIITGENTIDDLMVMCSEFLSEAKNQYLSSKDYQNYGDNNIDEDFR